jgi:hypothetical protein
MFGREWEEVAIRLNAIAAAASRRERDVLFAPFETAFFSRHATAASFWRPWLGA